MRVVFNLVRHGRNLDFEVNLVAFHLALIFNLSLLSLNVQSKAERDIIAIDPAVFDDGFPEHVTRRVAGQLVSVDLEIEGTFGGSVGSIHGSFPSAGDIGGGGGETKQSEQADKPLHFQ